LVLNFSFFFSLSVFILPNNIDYMTPKKKRDG